MQGVGPLEAQFERDAAVQTADKLKQRIQDLFGPEAAQLDATKAETLSTRKGSQA